MNKIQRIQKLEDELALLKAEIQKEQEPIICSNPAMSFEVHPEDLKRMNWDEAITACKKLGKGWRLPTRLELLIMYNNRDMVGGFAYNFYWSSTEFNVIAAWSQGFNDGNQGIYDKDLSGFVRAVRDVI